MNNYNCVSKYFIHLSIQTFNLLTYLKINIIYFSNEIYKIFITTTCKECMNCNDIESQINEYNKNILDSNNNLNHSDSISDSIFDSISDSLYISDCSYEDKNNDNYLEVDSNIIDPNVFYNIGVSLCNDNETNIIYKRNIK